ncbi:hypothetical protein [Streptomyces sp. NBC_00344]|uniref:hypothetical protein n=1 Tax=Streptomyces sp. NBC_00344 TaxID=2975720 RepID=UPI002E1BB677
MSRHGVRTAAFLAALGTTRTVAGVLRRRPPGGSSPWQRKNYAGRTVDLFAGPAATAGTLLGAAVLPPRTRQAAALAVLAAGVCGGYDDIAGAGDTRRGFGAHLSALREGEVTSGAVKLFGIGAAALAAGTLLKERPVDRLLAGIVVAGTAHLVNLVDVRPGRATIGVLGLAAPGLLRRGPAGVAAAVPLGAAAAVVIDDLGEQTMIGDAGAHALGAALGVAIVVGNGRAGLAAHAAALVTAAAYGDKVSRAAAG